MRSRKNNYRVLLVLLAFTLVGVARYWNTTGEDLASSYVGCRLLAEGEASHLYSRSTKVFTDTDDPVWAQVALRTGFSSLNLLHPYVQTPLWAWSLQPVCTRVSFQGFRRGFVILLMLCISALLWLVARYWTPMLFHPGWMALVYGVLFLSEPFKYDLFLAQTQILIILMSIAAIFLAERNRAVWAGVLLALAALIKITPGYLFLYWIVTRRWKAAGAFAIAFAALFLFSIVATGTEVNRAYLQSLAANSNVLLVAFNNQSLAAWCMGFVIPRIEAYRWNIYHLPLALKILSLALSVAGSVVGGLMDREHAERGSPGHPPNGAIFTMLAATLFTPIAWLHYYVLLIIPAMILLQASQKHPRRRMLLRGLVLVLVLNLYPISFGAIGLRHRRISLVRSQFFSGVVMMGMLLVLAWDPKGSSSDSDSGHVVRFTQSVT